MRITLQMLADASGDGQAPILFEPSALVAGRIDEVMLNLARALIPAFVRPTQVTTLFADHLVLAAAAHLASEYTRPGRRLERPKQGLAPWQQRRAADMMLDRLHVDTTLAAIATACGLSPGHFSKAFRVSFGMPPHRWLLRERVRRASELMATTNQPINEIAVGCGFVDQSHLSRVFRNVMGSPPAAWRRARAAG